MEHAGMSDDIQKETERIHQGIVESLSFSEALAKRDAEIERLRGALTQTSEAWGIGQNTIAQLRAAMEVRERDHLEKTAEIERLHQEKADILAAKEIVFVPPAIPESFVIQELQKANVALHADIARLRSGVRCPRCDGLRLELGDARREIERLRAYAKSCVRVIERSEWIAAVQRNDEITRSADCRDKAEEIARLRGALAAVSTVEGSITESAAKKDAEIERLHTLLREMLEDGYVHVPYGASHEDVSAILDFEKRVREALGDVPDA